MKFEAQQIAQKLGGVVEGDPKAEVYKLCKIEEGEKGGLSFLANPKYTHYIYQTQASIVIVNKDFVAEQPVHTTLIRVNNAYMAFAQLLSMYNDIQQNKGGISQLAFIHPSARIGENCYIGEFAYIGENVVIGDNSKIYPQTYLGDNAQIGKNTTLFAGVKVYCNNMIGNNCILHSGAVIGADGFGFAPKAEGGYDKIAQIGNVIIEDNVEIGANTCIDRATLGSTIVHKGVKLDNLCQIAHNVVVGENTAMASQSGVAGSSKIGKNCIMAGQVGIVGHIEVGDNVTIAAQSGVTKAVQSNSIMLGSPALPIDKMRKIYVYERKLEEMAKRIADLEKKINDK
ncbi:MAG: UDP-3-O-(3-hydroxymyristoyl)glucosamine N-acyltransferase [Bacteroidales bacterium]|nr:UDP-3-O-(3-hydroxymyristoyl)glucosamine N-acyltransferase [Bacteroidales bacterium]